MESKNEIDVMMHGSDRLEDLEVGKGFRIELVMSIKKTQKTKMIIYSRKTSSVTSICKIIIMYTQNINLTIK